MRLAIYEHILIELRKMELSELNPIPRQALGYAEWVRGEQIHPRTLAVNTAFILQ